MTVEHNYEWIRNGIIAENRAVRFCAPPLSPGSPPANLQDARTCQLVGASVLFFAPKETIRAEGRMPTLKRQIVASDLESKGFPFECLNCGNKPTPQSVVELGGDCEICGDSVVAYTVDTAQWILEHAPRVAREER